MTEFNYLNLTNELQVVLCGGVSKMPKLQQAIKETLPQSELLSNLTADEVIALGCCHQAAVAAEPWDPDCINSQVDVPALSRAVSIKVSLTFFIKCCPIHFYHFIVPYCVTVRWRRR